MHDLLFYVFAAVTLVCGGLVVANPLSRNPVTSAMFLVLAIVGLAGLFVLLRAYFLAAVQILVYAGAVMVLFLFVIMLLDLKAEERRRIRTLGLLTGVVGVAALLALLATAIVNSGLTARLAPPMLEGLTAPLGKALFQEFLLPFEVLSVLLLVAMVGVILLSKKELR